MSLALVDKSAYVRGSLDQPGTYELCLCAVTRLEVLHSARGPAEYELVADDLDAFRDLRMNHETWQIAATAHAELARNGQHRVAIPDLLVAACAQQHGADVLYVDRYFDVLATVLAFEAIRVAGR